MYVLCVCVCVCVWTYLDITATFHIRKGRQSSRLGFRDEVELGRAGDAVGEHAGGAGGLPHAAASILRPDGGHGDDDVEPGVVDEAATDRLDDPLVAVVPQVAQEEGDGLDGRLVVLLQVRARLLDLGRLAHVVRQVLVVDEEQLEPLHLAGVVGDVVTPADLVFLLLPEGDGGWDFLLVRVGVQVRLPARDDLGSFNLFGPGEGNSRVRRPKIDADDDRVARLGRRGRLGRHWGVRIAMIKREEVICLDAARWKGNPTDSSGR